MGYIVESEERESPTGGDGQPAPTPLPVEQALAEEARLERALRDSGLL